MRDIRSDLRDRLQATTAQRAELSRRLRALEAREQRLRALLQDEEALRGLPQHVHLRALPGTSQGTHLREFVLRLLRNGQAWSLEDLKEQARRALGLTTVGAAGRSLNITLVNLLRQRRVLRLPDGRWQLQDQAPQLELFSSADLDPPDGEAQLAS